MDLDLIRIFVKVVQNGSFSRAAALMKLPKSTVSKAVAALERESGAKLLLRTTRSLTLTPSGKSFYESALGPVLALEDARKRLQGKDSVLSGRIKLTAPEDLGGVLIAPVLGRLTRENPELSFEVVYSGEILDLVKDGFDIAVRIGKLNESSFKAKLVGYNTMILVAAPSYLKGKKIQRPQELAGEACLSYNERAFESQWQLKNGRQSASVKVATRVACNQMASLLHLACEGAGIAMLPDFLCEEALRQGKLKQVLPGWAGPVLPVHIITLQPANSSARLKLSVDAIEASLKAAFKP